MHSLEDNGTFIIIFKYLLSKGKSNSLYIFKAWGKKKVKILIVFNRKLTKRFDIIIERKRWIEGKQICVSFVVIKAVIPQAVPRFFHRNKEALQENDENRRRIQ